MGRWNHRVDFRVINRRMDGEEMIRNTNVHPVLLKTLPSTSKLHVDIKQMSFHRFCGFVDGLHLLL
jgi:hypothetical protein